MTFRPALALLLGLTVVTCASAQSAADLGAGSHRKAATWPLKPDATQAQAAQLSARFLTRFHYDAQPLDDAMSQKIYKAYIKLLDPDKVFFTKQDMDQLAPDQTKLDDAIWNQDLSVPFDIYNKFLQRAVQRMSYARDLLKGSFDFNGDESYQYDRKDAGWAKDDAALDDLWRKRTMNDWLRLKLAGKGDDDIRKTLTKRYNNYIERVKQLDSEDAFQAFMTAYANTTDPHTDYLSPRAAEDFAIQMKLSLEGIGAQLQSRDDYTIVFTLIPGGPAEKSGKLKPGDRILGVGQGDSGPFTDVIGWRIDDVVNLIRGKKDTTVRLEILPADAGPDGKHEVISLVRKKVNIEESAAKKKIIDVKDGDVVRKIGVIDLPSFYSDFGARSEGDKDFRSATRDVAKLVGELKTAGVQGIIVDLRSNGGGSLAEADSMTGLFTGKGPVVQVRDARGQVDVQGADNATPLWDGPLAVMVNRGTASASEIFSAAIQDYGRGLIIGTPSFGKGTVQTLIDLDRFSQNPDGKPQYGELKMTVQEFFRINGGSTQIKGVTPDISFPGNGDAKDFGESTYDNALPWTHIAPADYKTEGDVKAYVQQLDSLHDARVATSPAWKLMLDQLAQYKTMRDQTSVSLNFAKREAERKQQDAMQASFRERQKAIDGSDAYLKDEDSALDDGLDPSERSLKTELQQQKDAKDAPDAQLREAAHIVSDEVDLLKADPKAAAVILPPGSDYLAQLAATSAQKPAAAAASAKPAAAASATAAH
ncbi:carboxy terminal-processing peptidase [Rhodanobacter sp. DHB23]|uniref:carboxy terminal-processing peptidase n=1 Tax=Rhodanobacter sp. DHB23 TaxID=2775923 RepID=UPI00177C4789|nr:carboxy terminal-processing peptidase [Rhodanobacter sp. DHB23]MBD8871463.1 carboxy terminal-processing peptidase [Rhodanobacter sp. DHB23]